MSPIMNAIAELFRELFIGGFMAGLVHIFVNQFKGKARHTGEAIGASVAQAAEKSLEEHRSELFKFLRNRLSGVDPEAAERIEEFLKARRNLSEYSPRDENIAVSVLVDLYMHLNEPSEEQDRIEVFRTLGQGTREDFDHAIEFLNNDMAWQWFLKLRNTIRDGGAWTIQAIKKLVIWATNEKNIGYVLEARNKIAEQTAKTLQTTRKKMEKIGLNNEYVPPLQFIFRKLRRTFESTQSWVVRNTPSLNRFRS